MQNQIKPQPNKQKSPWFFFVDKVHIVSRNGPVNISAHAITQPLRKVRERRREAAGLRASLKQPVQHVPIPQEGMGGGGLQVK